MKELMTAIEGLTYDVGLARRAEGLYNKKTPGVLWNATRELHHACESHPVGAAMSDGTISDEWWAEWVAALYAMHKVLDPYTPKTLQRSEALLKDARGMLPVIPRPPHIAMAFAASLSRPQDRDGAIYVLAGAHLMGGALTMKRFKEAGRNLPTAHLEWSDRKAALADFTPYRENLEAAPAARETFKVLLKVMQNIASGGT